MSATRTVRLPSDGIVGGVAAGLGSCLGIAPEFVRISFILLIFAGGFGAIAYFGTLAALTERV